MSSRECMMKQMRKGECASCFKVISESIASLFSHEGTKARRHEEEKIMSSGVTRDIANIAFCFGVRLLRPILFPVFPSPTDCAYKSQRYRNNKFLPLPFLRAFVPSCLRVRKQIVPLRVCVSFFLCLIATCFFTGCVPSYVTRSPKVTGRVIDARTRLPLSGAKAEFLYETSVSAISDAQGRFILPETKGMGLIYFLPYERITRIRVSRERYETCLITFWFHPSIGTSESPVEFFLQPSVP